MSTDLDAWGDDGVMSTGRTRRLRNGVAVVFIVVAVVAHGNVFWALREVESITMDLDVAGAETSDVTVQIWRPHTSLRLRPSRLQLG
jgi:hypothetical protein